MTDLVDAASQRSVQATGDAWLVEETRREARTIASPELERLLVDEALRESRIGARR